MVGQSWGPLNNCQLTAGKTCSLEREEGISAHLQLEVLLGKLALLVLFALSQGCHEKQKVGILNYFLWRGRENENEGTQLLISQEYC